jgi:hypothetical protein
VIESDVEVARLAQQRMRSAVNFGVASLRRGSGAPPDELLELRCECGQPGCTAEIPISIRDYQAAPLIGALLVLPAHADPKSTVPRASTVAWIVVELRRDQTAHLSPASTRARSAASARSTSTAD